VGEREERTDAVTVCVEHADLLAIYHLEEILDLLLLGCLVIVLPRDGGVRLGVDVALLEIGGHLECMCGRKALEARCGRFERCSAGCELDSW
jgi:hypothetical protein